MRFSVFVMSVALSLFSNISLAGSPISKTVVCPVDGEQFKTTGTLSCSTMGRTISFRSITSCEFVTRLPVCPGNGLPIYQEFSDKQVMNLRKFLETAEFEALRKLPQWQRAHGVSQHLGQSGTGIAFNLLLNAAWYETKEFLENDAIIDLFLAEAESELSRVPAKSRPFLDAIVAYVLSAAGRFEEADVRLNRAAKTVGATQYLLQYVAAIRDCQPNMTKKGCRPNDRFNP